LGKKNYTVTPVGGKNVLKPKPVTQPKGHGSHLKKPMKDRGEREYMRGGIRLFCLGETWMGATTQGHANGCRCGEVTKNTK